MSRRRTWMVAASGAVPAVVFAAWLWQGWGGRSTTRAVDDVGLLAFGLFAAGCCLFAARRVRGRHRGTWLALGAGLSAWSIGEVIWCYYELWQGRDQAPFPSPADAAFLLFPVAVAAALLLFPTGRRARSRVRLILDGVLVAGSLFVVSWVSALGSVYRAGADGRFVFAVALAYPVSDLVIVTMSIVVLAQARTAHRMTLGLLGSGIVLMALSDSAFAYLSALGIYHSGSLIDLGWPPALIILGLAALCASQQPAPDLELAPVPTSARMWLPYLPVLLAGAVGAHRLFSDLSSGPLPAAAGILVIGLLARQFIVLAENRRLLLTVTEQAFRDPLTGLANRALFLDRLTHAIHRHRRHLLPLAVVCLDLDDFKLVNDSLGHPAGDELLIRVAERLTGCVRATDTVARLGGDEFAILIEEDAADALLLTDRVAEAFAPPFMIEGHRLDVRASIGLTTATAEAVDVRIENLLKQADLAMYAAKRSGAGGVQMFEPAFEGADDHTEKLWARVA